MSVSQLFESPSGKKIGYLELGSPSGEACFFFHGVPGSSRQILLMKHLEVFRNFRVIAFDRPGFGETTFSKNRKLQDGPALVEELARHLGIGKFHLIAVSGGGPPAVIAADRLRDRVLSLTIVSGLGPLHRPELFAEMAPMGRKFLNLARWSSWATSRLLMTMQKQIQQGRVPDPAKLRRFLPEEDVAIIMNPKIREVFRESMRHAFRQGPLGAAVEMKVFQQDWGVRDWDFPFPVHLWHGLKDRIVPPAHSRWLAKQMPKAVLHEIAEEAHYSLPINRIDEILKPVVALDRTCPRS